MARDGGALPDVLEQMRAREESEHNRYLSIYDWNSHDLSLYDLIVDTTDLTEHEVVEEILKKMKPLR
jgi:cytidylate kinase